MAESNKIRVRLVTPERVMVEQYADAVELPASSGYMEVLYGHAPLLAELGAGDVTLHGATNGPGAEQNIGNSDRYNVTWGFVEVLPDRVTILANDAIAPAEIDVPRAQKQLESGQQMWTEAGDSEDAYTDAEHVINEAEAKLASAAQK